MIITLLIILSIGNLQFTMIIIILSIDNIFWLTRWKNLPDWFNLYFSIKFFHPIRVTKKTNWLGWLSHNHPIHWLSYFFKIVKTIDFHMFPSWWWKLDFSSPYTPDFSKWLSHHHNMFYFFHILGIIIPTDPYIWVNFITTSLFSLTGNHGW